MKDLKIAVIGSGIAGLSAAWALSRRHQVSLYEQDDYLGGHANTVDIEDKSGVIPVDTGFIVFNPPNYPCLSRLFQHLAVETVETDMSFGVSIRGGELEYAGSDLNGLFAQRRNLFRPRFWKMLQDIRRFYGSAKRYLSSVGERSIGELLDQENYSEAFIDDHLIPMAAAIWSASNQEIKAYPAADFIRFFANHDLLDLGHRPRWHTVKGGSREYVRRLVADTNFHAIKHAKVHQLSFVGEQITVTDVSGHEAQYDEVVIATHADQALKLLAQPDSLEREILGVFRYSENIAVLHEDTQLMPKRKSAWSSWNYLQRDTGGSTDQPLCVSYWMNKLQALETQRNVFVTLNPYTDPAADLTHGRFNYTHPIFDQQTSLAQARSIALQGRKHVWYCGAYLGHGFHEDGIQAGLWVAEQLGCETPWGEQETFSRLASTYETALRRVA